MTSSVAPRATPFGHQFEEVARLGGGVDGGAHFAGNVVLDGADEDGLAGSGVEQRLDQKCRGRFAVGAGDARGRELALRDGRRRPLKPAASARRPCSTSSNGRPG